MNYWLMKSEPETFGIDALAARPRRTTHWDGVRNFQARNFMRDQMRIGDLAFFYHSNCDEPGIVGIVKVVKEGYPDDSAFDRKDKHYDAESDPSKPRWYMVDVQLQRKLKATITLATWHVVAQTRQSSVDHAGERCTLAIHTRSSVNEARVCIALQSVTRVQDCAANHTLHALARDKDAQIFLTRWKS